MITSGNDRPDSTQIEGRIQPINEPPETEHDQNLACIVLKSQNVDKVTPVVNIQKDDDEHQDLDCLCRSWCAYLSGFRSSAGKSYADCSVTTTSNPSLKVRTVSFFHEDCLYLLKLTPH